MKKTKSEKQAKNQPKSQAKRKPKAAASGRERMRIYRERMRAAGYRPVQHWVLDLRKPEIAAEIRRQAALLDKHPENAVLDAWIDAVYEIGD